MSYDQKLAEARQIIENHNQVVDNKISFEDFKSNLQAMGGTTEGSLQGCSFEDLEQCGIPSLLAKQISQKIFRMPSTEEMASSNVVNKSCYVSEKKAQSMTIKELLERYDPNDIENAIGKRLEKMSKGLGCIVFNNDGSINVDVSAALVEDIRKGLPELTKTLVKGRPCTIFKVGQRPDCFIDENPLYAGRVLRSNGICDQTGRSWEGVPDVIKQLLYLAITETEELKIDSLDDAHSAMDKAIASNAEVNIRSRYPNASILFDDKSKIGSLPTLKIRLDEVSNKKKNNPFEKHQTY